MLIFVQIHPKIHRQIYQRYQSLGCDIPPEYTGDECVDESNDVRLSQEDERVLKTAISHFERESTL